MGRSRLLGFVKAVESEVIRRVLIPLRQLLQGESLEGDRQDRDLKRVVSFLADQNEKPPELGAFAYFLKTCLTSKNRRITSSAVAGFYKLLSNWPDSAWLGNEDGFHASLDLLRDRYRNKAAHLNTLSQPDYEGCRELVVGSAGTLWKTNFKKILLIIIIIISVTVKYRKALARAQVHPGTTGSAGIGQEVAYHRVTRVASPPLSIARCWAEEYGSGKPRRRGGESFYVPVRPPQPA